MVIDDNDDVQYLGFHPVNISHFPKFPILCVLQETLTGFKWMGNKTAELQRQGKSVLFAYEEAIGFMCGTEVLDKDGISAGIRVAEMAAYLSKKDMSLMDKLKELFSV